jgi:GntR family transcriptional regulator/MocR family aminotransferase
MLGIPVDASGIVADRLPTDPSGPLLYVTPSHQFPLGATMTLPRRLQVLRWATTTHAWILEDDYDSEFRYDGRPIAALQGLDTAGRVLYLGTWNKVLFPGLRLAYLVVPPGLVEPFVAARALTDGASPVLMQQVLTEFLTGGYLAAHLRQSRRTYAERRDALLASLRRHWGLHRAVTGPDNTGLHLVVRLPDGTDDTALAARLPNHHPLGIAPLSRYYTGPQRLRGLLISYGSATPAEIDDAVRLLAPGVSPPRGRLRGDSGS